MFASRLRITALAAVAAAGLAACTTPYGYSGVSVGLGNGYYGSDYGYGSNYGYGYGGGYPGYAYGYGAGYPGYGLGYAPYWGWYDDCYYPGTGNYVYDVDRRPHRWTDAQRRYWSERRERALASTSGNQRVVIRENWNDFSRNRSTVQPTRVDRAVNRPERIERSIKPERVEPSVARQERVQQRIDRSEARAVARDERRSEARSSVTREERASRSNDRARGSKDD